MKYGLFCPLKTAVSETTSISCLNLYIPVVDGQNFKGSYSGISKNNGDLVSHYEKAPANGVFSAASLTLESTKVSVPI
jgi:hypothetical protein